MPEGREIDAAELLDVAKDEDRARSLHRTLRSLSAGSDAKLRQMAASVLRGDITPQQAFTDPEYMAVLFSRAADIRRAGDERSAAEVREAGERFDGWQEERRAADERERTEQEAPRHVATTRSVPKHHRVGPGRPGRHAGPGGGVHPEGPFRHR